MGEVRERCKQAWVIETVDRGPALELPQLPVETRAAEEAGCRGYAQMPGLGQQNLEALRMLSLGERGVCTAHGARLVHWLLAVAKSEPTQSTRSRESLGARSGVFTTLAWAFKENETHPCVPGADLMRHFLGD